MLVSQKYKHSGEALTFTDTGFYHLYHVMVMFVCKNMPTAMIEVR